ncbi:restriction endonuclease subunit S [Pseudoalteromonas sp. Z9A5]|uniref:restriction endonuclease subunit S n=1 Tax=Pseudoalteromonas sp. Z9A5 TaxID=2686355 RepID=UPI001407D390|nr:restriction endonuclease subunit S [Pseudoalteromonas sp. Z9A5]
MIKELPESWSLISFGDFLDIQGGSQPPKSAFKSEPSDGYIRLLQIRDFGKKPVPTYVPKDSVTKLCEKDDIFVARYGASLGRILTGMEGAYNVALAKVIYSKALFEKKYLFYLLKTSIFQAPIMMISRSAQNGFNKGDLYPIEIPVAPKKQQLAISNKIEELFSHIDAGVAGLKQAKAKLQQYRQSVLKDAVTGKLTETWREQNADKLEPAVELLERILQERRANWEAEQLKAFEEKGKVPRDDKWKDKYKDPLPPETEDVPDIPIEWGYLRLEAISNIQGGITVDAKRKSDETTLLPYLRVANVQRGYLDLSKMKDIRVPNDKVDSLLLQDGDILFNEGGDRDKLGRGWVWRNEIDKCIYQNHVFRARLYSNELVPEFVSIFGNTIGKEYFIKQGKQTTNLASINKTKLSAFPVPFCSLNEMTKIIEFVTNKVGKTDRTIIELDKKILHASQLKSSILAKAFSGELIENIETDETAEQLLEKIQAEKQLLEEKAKLAKKKPNTRAKKMDKQPIINVLKKAKKALSVDELFEQAGFQNDVSPEGIEAFYQELKIVTENENVTVTPVMLKEKKQGDKFEYKEVKENEAG